MRDLKSITLDIQDGLAALVISREHEATNQRTAEQAEKRCELLTWLSVVDTSIKFQTLLGLHLGTGEWLIGDSGFSNWKHGRKPILWLYGIGKFWNLELRMLTQDNTIL